MAGIVTLEQVRSWLRYNTPSQPTADDTALQSLIDAVTEVIEFHAGVVVPRVITELRGGGTTSLWTWHNPIISVISVREQWPGGATYDLQLTSFGDPPSSAFAYSLDSAETGCITRRSMGMPSPFIGEIELVYVAGREAPYPAAIMLATKELVAFCWQHSELRGVSMTGAEVSYDSTVGMQVRTADQGSVIALGLPTRTLQYLISEKSRLPVIALDRGGEAKSQKRPPPLGPPTAHGATDSSSNRILFPVSPGQVLIVFRSFYAAFRTWTA